MKLIKMLALVLVVMMLGTTALAGTMGDAEVQNLANDIQLKMETNKYMDSDWENLYLFQGYSTDQICEALMIAYDELGFSSFATAECVQTYLDYVSSHSNISYHGALIRDLGDESVPMYVLCGLAAVALAGVVFANKKRACA